MECVCVCVCVYVYEKTQQFRVPRFKSNGNSRAHRSFSCRKLPGAGGCLWDARRCSLPKCLGLQLSSLLKHTLNLHSNLLPHRGAHSSLNQADLTQRLEHMVPSLFQHRCRKHFPIISKPSLLTLDQNRGQQVQNSRVGENMDLRGRQSKAELCSVPWDKLLSSLSPLTPLGCESYSR